MDDRGSLVATREAADLSQTLIRQSFCHQKDLSGCASEWGTAGLAPDLRWRYGQPVAYLTGRTTHQASTTYRGEGNTDARDAFIIADQARIRRDVSMLRPGDDIALDLRLLSARRLGVVHDRTRQINRLRAQLLEYFPALERTLDLTKKGPVLLLTAYQTPAAIRRMGVRRLETWLRNRKVQRAGTLAATVVEAAQAQMTALRGEELGAELAGRLARSVATHDDEVAELDARIEARFREHRDAEVILTLPGMGPTTGAEFIAATGGDLTAFASPDRPDRLAGLAPVPWDSGKVSGNLRRPRRYHRGLHRALYLSTQVSIFFCPVSKAYYDRKRKEGKGHKQAVIALARRRVNVLWAMTRDHTPFETTTGTPLRGPISPTRLPVWRGAVSAISSDASGIRKCLGPVGAHVHRHAGWRPGRPGAAEVGRDCAYAVVPAVPEALLGPVWGLVPHRIAPAAPHIVAVLVCGHTELKLAAFDPASGRELWHTTLHKQDERLAPHSRLAGPAACHRSA
ncbi:MULTISPECIES: IS110 family transposase [unclassified Streptomyces]|uniref:IS110 family transposase n=1 Tax=unclassified Streptomyces TaxID=2593676 RepID=UPI002D219168|nr:MULTISPECIES: IS110 family transposase [unclassified Streptomyces]